MKAVADTLAVARSTGRAGARPTKSRRSYRKAADEPLLVLIRRLVDERPTYGYRRITRLVNRQQKAEGKPAINAKRVLRIMQVNKLTLERHTGRRPGRTHDGVVIALRSNIRWCSDHFELACRNGELRRVLFAIDACDREVIAWSATTAGISGEMVRDLMIVCVERRFGTSKTPYVVEWLSDNGSAYIAKDTLHTATALGSAALLHPGPLAGIQWDRRGLRQNLQTRLCSIVDLAGRRDRHRAAAGVVRGLLKFTRTRA